METLIAFAAGYLLSWPSLVVLFIIGTWAEHNDSRGWAVFFGLMIAVVSYFYFNLTLSGILTGAVAYLVAGVLWSFWRYKRKLASVVQDLSTNYRGPDYEDHRKRQLLRYSPSQMAGTITAWVLIWPLSFIGNMLGDILDSIQYFVTKFFKGVYHRIYSSAIADFERKTDGI